jgi:SAM-dependent methyltransferase
MSAPSKCKPGRGYIEHLGYQDGYILIRGWMFLPNELFDRIILKINKVLFGEAKLIERQDVQRAFPFIPVPSKCGFEFNFPISEDIFRDWVDIDILGIHDGKEIAVFSTIYLLNFFSSLPVPTANLRERVTGEKELMFYWCGASKIYGEFLKAIVKYRDTTSIRNLLDWGCGCGRVTSLFLRYSNISEIYGCDIDKEAVKWCEEYLQPGHFSSIDPYPPTNFHDNMFDVVTGCSVLTHLKRELQLSWIEEIKRILRPGGYFFTSVHGEFATIFTGSDIQKEVIETGISDISTDSILDDIAPDGYYRGVYQTKAYTLKEWGKHLKVIDYIDRGMGNFQDLVIMQK